MPPADPAAALPHQFCDQIISSIRVTWYSSGQARSPFQSLAKPMRDYSFREKTRIAAGAVTAVVIVAWLAVVALALLSGG
jgi:hypothetical protein